MKGWGPCLLLGLVQVLLTTSLPTKKADPYPIDRDVRGIEADVTFTPNGVLSSKAVTGLCDDVKQYAGYFNVTTATKHYFYWFFESRNAPSTDPVVLWMTGGPGCSSLLALFEENGPCTPLADGASTARNPWGWNRNASLLFVDQPAGVGFSYGAPADYDSDEDGVAADMYNFLQAFLTAHPAYRPNPFHVFGESYGGHFVPATAYKIYQAARAPPPPPGAPPPPPPINLRGVGIGNGLTAPEIQYRHYAEMAFRNSVQPLVSRAVYDAMRLAVPACVAEIEACQRTRNGSSCAAAFALCAITQVTPVQVTGVNLYDIRKDCGTNPLCYDFSRTQRFLNNPTVQAALGTSGRKWTTCNMEVNSKFNRDWMHHFQTGLPDMLAAGIRVLVYAGDVDYICNWLGNKAWTLALPWPGGGAFQAEGDHEWTVTGKVRGLARSAGGLTFLQVYEAGHMVPMDQPEPALALLNTFLADAPFY